MEAEDEMLIISEVARRTKIPVDTIRYWARRGELAQAELRRDPRGLAWYTTERAVKERRKNTKMGRPRKA